MRSIKRPISHVLGERGENLVAGIFLRNSWIVEKLTHDYGYDFLLQVTKDNETIPAFAMLQVKSVRHWSEAGPHIRLRTSRIIRWTLTPIPVWLAVAELSSESTYLVTVDEITGMLKQRLGDSWSASRTRRLELPKLYRLTDEKTLGLASALEAYWKAMQHTWLLARETAFRDRSPDRETPLDWQAPPDVVSKPGLSVYMPSLDALQEVVLREAYLRAEHGDERAAALLRRAEIQPLTCTPHAGPTGGLL